MNKKIISSILVVAVLNLVGCYNFQSVNVPEYKQVEEVDKQDDIRVITKDSQEYQFMRTDYYIENDTLYGKGKLLLGDKEQQLDRKIALTDIESLRVNKLDGMTTAGLVIGLLIVSGIIIYAIVLSDALSNR